MLIKMWRWLMYGENQVFYYGISMVFMTLFISGYLVLQPLWESYEQVQAQSKKFEEIIALDVNALKTLVVDPARHTVRMSWEEIGVSYQMATRRDENVIYYAGNTGRILEMLNFILNDAYEISGFQIEKTENKTLLALFL